MPKVAKYDWTLVVKISDAGRALLVMRAAEDAGGNMSAMVRRMLKYAAIHMPKGWK